MEVAAPEHEALVMSVKEMQRNDPAARESWAQYTDWMGQGRKDPAKHTAEFLNAFLVHLQSGQRVPAAAVAAGSEDVSSLVEIIKVMQKKSQPFRNAWTQFCKEFGNGTNDPNKHDMTYIVKFFELISDQASKSGDGMGTPGPMARAMSGGKGSWGAGPGPIGSMPTKPPPAWGAAGYAEPLQKRMRDNSGASLGTSWSTGANLVPGTKEYLVAQVKAYQRLGEQQKELWGVYADTYLGGVRDPARHDGASLQEFCANHGVPPPPSSQGAAAALAMDPAKQTLVMRVKAFQKAGVEQAEAWKAFAVTTFDPARHDTERLQEFINMYSIP